MTHSNLYPYRFRLAAIWMVLVTALALVDVCAIILLEYQVVLEERMLAGSSYLPIVHSLMNGLRGLRGQ